MKLLRTMACLIFVAPGAFAQSPTQPGASPRPSPQQLKILQQPDSPIRISSARVTWATPNDSRGIQVYIEVENVGEKSVRTYRTRRDVNSVDGPKACLGPGIIPGRILRPQQKTGTSTWQGVFNSDPAPSVWVDFVEFGDGTTWGADECHVVEWLEGSRAGVRMQREQLLPMLREKGADALVELIRKNFQSVPDPDVYDYLLNAVAEGRIQKPLFPIWPPPGHSRDWQVAFLAGAAGTLRDVIEAYQRWGGDEIEHVLTRPIVATEKEKP
jgi:hypothetical protein